MIYFNMKDIVDSLNGMLQDITKDPYMRFVVKKNVEMTKFGAFRKYIVTLYLHIPGKNIECLEYTTVLNMSNLSSESIDREIRNGFLHVLLAWIYKGKMKEVIDGLQMEQPTV